MTAILTRLLIPFFLMYLKISKQSIWKFKTRLMSHTNPLLEALYDRYFANYGGYVGLGAHIESEPCFPHGPYGVFISSGASLGKNVVIFQHVTIGSNSLADGNNQGSPVIGDNCYIGAGAKIIGKVNVGNNCRIGANAVVYSDMAPNSVAVQSPTRIIQKNNLDNRFIRYKNGQKIYFNNGDWITSD